MKTKQDLLRFELRGDRYFEETQYNTSSTNPENYTFLRSNRRGEGSLFQNLPTYPLRPTYLRPPSRLIQDCYFRNSANFVSLHYNTRSARSAVGQPAPARGLLQEPGALTAKRRARGTT